MNVGKKIQERREILGLSADDLAAALGVNRSTIYRYENGDISKLPIYTLEPLSKILQTTPAYLMGWHSNSQNEHQQKSNFTSTEYTLITKYRKLSDESKRKVRENIDDLLLIDEIKLNNGRPAPSRKIAAKGAKGSKGEPKHKSRKIT